MAALAGMTVVVEAASRSGSLITTDLARLELLGYLACSSVGNYSRTLLRSKL